ncbi:MAG: ABC transporter permease [Anaerolineaceae bacterium]|nr:ABC transporter permease [Anaerolineaceae bacterium]
MGIDSRIAELADITEAIKCFDSEKDLHIIRSGQSSLLVNLQEIWAYRELLVLLAWRDIKVRYKQTYLGVAWAIIQPLFSMIVFSVIFGQLAKLPSEGVPYPIYTFAALLPWQLFSYSFNASSNSLVGNERLIEKVYFPRLILPLASVMAGVIDFLFGFLIYILLMFVFHVPITIRLLAIPLLLIFTVFTALSIGIWMSAINVKYRDVRYIVPFIIQIWMYASPVAYSVTIIPDQWKWLYGLNPIVGVIEGFRWALLGIDTQGSNLILLSVLIVIVIFIFSINYFKKTEEIFVDVL